MASDEEESASYKEVRDPRNEDEWEICRLSHPSDPHTLVRRISDDPTPITECFSACELEMLLVTNYYCTTCDVQFHFDCYKRPRQMTHPYHPQHPLVFTIRNPGTGHIFGGSVHDLTSMRVNGVGINYDNIFDSCTWCGENIKTPHKFFYRCSICNFCLCRPCSQKFPLPTISNPKNHHHSLIFLPRPLLLPCDGCGSIDRSDPSYVCFQCNFVVHKNCIDLPRVIKITRHPHRLFYTPFLSPKISSCRLCYKTVDIKYGQYSCNHDDCSYVAHSKCATHEKVWDGSELEWDPEESDETEDFAPFKKVGDDWIEYFCHEHHLKLEKYDGVRDADKQCQACTLHIDSRDFYNCMECEFFLHEVCANLSRKIDHALHHHPLFLDLTPPNEEADFLQCVVCSRPSSGFKYTCANKSCDRKFQIDVGCILVPDCFTHKSHEHPLFIPISNAKLDIICGGCNKESRLEYLQCTLCEFPLCYKCATIPDKLHYRNVASPLSLCYGEASDETYWCDVCERKLDPRKWFYTSNKPYITIHRKCVFGSFAYMKPGYTFYTISLSVEVRCNSSNTRPICNICNCRCSSSVYFIMFSDEMVIFCVNCFKIS